MTTRGIRGATTVDGTEDVSAATAELLERLASANGYRPEELAGAIFTMTDDLAGANPAAAGRALGWDDVPMLVVREHDEGLPRCVRVLLLWNTEGPVRHVYLRGAAGLRPDRRD